MDTEHDMGNKFKERERLSEKERVDLVEDVVTRGLYEIVEGKPGELKHRLLHDKLRVKFGTDPTSPNIHFGRAVPLLKLRDLQMLGHQIVLIIGDFTGEVGDTSDKESGRPMLTEEKVKANMQTYVEQAGKILDMTEVEVHYNSEWLSDLSFSRISRLADLFGLNDFISRDIIKRRLSKGQRVSVRELLYPLMQGYDSVEVKADLELGGDDQRFNLLAGRTIQASFGMPKQMILMTNLIPGTDGRKMSSSLGNTINLQDPPENMFGKIMSANDSVMADYFEHCTRVPMDRVREISKQLEEGTANPRETKILLAETMTEEVYGKEKALKAKGHFITVFHDKGIPEDIKEFDIGEGSRKIIDILLSSGLASSKSDAKRLLTQRGIKINGKTATEGDEVPEDSLLQKGKRVFLKIK